MKRRILFSNPRPFVTLGVTARFDCGDNEDSLTRIPTGCENVNLLSAQVLQEFGIVARKIRKDKSCFVVSAEGGSFTIKKSLDSCANVVFAHDIKEHLAANGFGCTDRFRVAVSGKPYVLYDGAVYICSETLSLRESSFSDAKDVCRAVEGIAQMHRLARGVPLDSVDKASYDNTFVQIQKDAADIAAIKRRLGSGGTLSDFDVIFLKNYGFYAEQMKDVISELGATKVQEYIQTAQTLPTIIHNRLKEETLLTDGNLLYITNFTTAKVGYSMLDLVSVISRYMRENPSDTAVLSVYELLEVYDKHNPLSVEDVLITRALLRFPFRFVKLLRAYYSKKRTWTPSAILSKMQTIVAGQESYYKHIE